MEANNLFLIQSCQDLRHDKEQEDIRYERLKTSIGEEKKKLEHQYKEWSKMTMEVQFDFEQAQKAAKKNKID